MRKNKNRKEENRKEKNRKEKNNSSRMWGIAGFFMAIAGIVFFFIPIIGLVFSITAIIFSSIQKRKKATSFGTAALIIGIIGIIINSIVLILFLRIITFIASIFNLRFASHFIGAFLRGL